MATPCPKCGEYRNGRHEHACKSVPTVQPMNARERMVRVVAETLLAHQRIPMFDGTEGQRCVGCDNLRGETAGPNSPRHTAHDAQVLAEGRERIAREIEAARPEYERSPWRMGMDEAARIARAEPTDSEVE